MGGISGQTLDPNRIGEYELDPVGRGMLELETCLASFGDVQHCFPSIVPAKACDLQLVRNVIGTLNQVCL